MRPDHFSPDISGLTSEPVGQRLVLLEQFAQHLSPIPAVVTVANSSDADGMQEYCNPHRRPLAPSMFELRFSLLAHDFQVASVGGNIGRAASIVVLRLR